MAAPLLPGLAVGASWPAAGAALTFLEMDANALNVLLAGLWPFDGDGPADPFIAGEWSDVFPCGAGVGIGEEGLAQVGGDGVDDAGGEPGGHGNTLTLTLTAE